MLKTKTGLNGIRLETPEQKEIIEKWNGSLRKEIIEKGDKMLRADKTEKEVNGLITKIRDKMERMEGMEKGVNGYVSEKREITERKGKMETGSVKVKMVKGMVTEYFEEAENQDGTEIWEEMSVKEISEDLGIWLTAYGPYKTEKREITEKGDNMETPEKMVKRIITEYFEGLEDLEGAAKPVITAGMSRDEILEDLSIWLTGQIMEITESNGKMEIPGNMEVRVDSSVLAGLELTLEALSYFKTDEMENGGTSELLETLNNIEDWLKDIKGVIEYNI